LIWTIDQAYTHFYKKIKIDDKIGFLAAKWHIIRDDKSVDDEKRHKSTKP